MSTDTPYCPPNSYDVGSLLKGTEHISLEQIIKPVFFVDSRPAPSLDIADARRGVVSSGAPAIESFFSRADTCSACFYVPFRDRRFSERVRDQVLYFFTRDKHEAIVFEWDWIDKLFVSRNEDQMRNPRRIII